MNQSTTQTLRGYWNGHIHDMSIVRHPVGTQGFFEDLREYRFDKQRYLPSVVDFSAYKNKRLLEVGCGVGIDLIQFAKHGAHVTGIDLSEQAIQLAEKNFELSGLKGDLRIMDGEDLGFSAGTFDVVYAHGVLPYTGDVQRMTREIHRVLKPGGEAILQLYNRRSWLYLLSKIMSVKLEHEDAPAFHTHSLGELKGLLTPFKKTQIIVERFPVKTRLHGGFKGFFYNVLFVGIFNAVPRPLVRRFGWHFLAKAIK
jgi:2-polyprenyl-3-methyl-5-hydroxy-6-metoxy-1,4-benzoquinol methylase